MRRQGNKLSALEVARLKKPGRYGDGHGLWLQVGPSGSKSWCFATRRDASMSWASALFYAVESGRGTGESPAG